MAWTPPEWDNVLINFGGVQFVPPEPTEVHLNFSEAEQGECSAVWKPALGNQLSIEFGSADWEYQPGNEIVINIFCEGEDEPEFVFFEGFLTGETGEFARYSITPEYWLPQIAHFGEFGSLEVSAFQNFQNMLGYTGEFSRFYIAEFYELEYVAHDGARAYFTLYESKNHVFDPIAHTGEVAAANLAVTLALDVYAFSGDIANFDLSDNPIWEPSPEVYTGECVEFLLSSEHDLGAAGWSGEVVQITDLIVTKPFLGPLVVYHGEVGSTAISTSVTLLQDARSGEVGSLQLETKPSEELIATGYEGETVEFELSVSYALFPTVVHGEVVSFGPIQTDPHWLLYSGEYSWFDLSANPSFGRLNAYSGDSVSLDVETRESAGFGSNLVARTGEEVSFDLIALKTASFEMVAYAGERSRFEFKNQWTFGEIHLKDYSCCAPNATEDPTRIDISISDPYDINYDGDAGQAFARFDLRTAPRFAKFEAFAGDLSEVPLYYPMEFTAFDGLSCSVGRDRTEWLTIRLCPGNFIPDASNAVIELSTEYDEDCDSILGFVGETVTVNIEYNQSMGGIGYSGEYSVFDMRLDPLMTFRAHAGEYVRTEIAGLPIQRAWVGESVTFDFPPETVMVYDGARAYITDIIVEYVVEFGESGCLDNEYVPATESGDPDWNEFREVPMETDTFYHMIKARCY